jgi:hypothetical protein
MSARQPKFGTFGRQAPDEPTQIRSRHFFLCRGLPNFSKFSLSTRGTYGVITVHQTNWYVYVGTQMRKLPIPVRGSAIPVLVPILELTSVLFLIAIFPKYNRIH